MYIYVYTYTYVHILTYIYLHTYIHTYCKVSSYVFALNGDGDPGDPSWRKQVKSDDTN